MAHSQRLHPVAHTSQLPTGGKEGITGKPDPWPTLAFRCVSSRAEDKRRARSPSVGLCSMGLMTRLDAIAYGESGELLVAGQSGLEAEGGDEVPAFAFVVAGQSTAVGQLEGV